MKRRGRFSPLLSKIYPLELFPPDIEMFVPSPTTTTTTTTTTAESLDELGFIVLSAEQKLERRRWQVRVRAEKQGGTYATYNQCKDLCKHMHHSKRGRSALFPKDAGWYWCKECEIMMKCSRCRCCGNLGRAKPRYRDRSRDNVKRIE